MTAAALIALAVFLCAVPACAAPESILEVTGFGFAGRARLGAWTPVWIDVTAPASGVDGTLTVDAPTPAGQPVLSFTAPVRAAPGVRVRVFVPAIFSDARTPGSIHLDDARGRLAAVPLPRLRPVDDVIVVLSAEPLGAEAAAARAGRIDVAYLTPETLPPVWQAYEAVRLLVVRDLDERRIDDAQRIAIRNWIWTGGRLLTMPAGDDRRHLQGPTLQPLLSRAVNGQAGRGRVTVWDRDGADAAVRGGPEEQQAWSHLLAAGGPTPAPSLEATLPAGRAVLLRTHAITGVLVLGYLLLIRRLSRALASLRLASVVVGMLLTAVVTWGAADLGVVARRDASGVVSSVVVESIPSTGYGLLMVFARTVSSHNGPFEVGANSDIFLRPIPPASVGVTRGADMLVRGSTSVQLAGTAVVPVTISGTIVMEAGVTAVTVTNRSGQSIKPAWILAAGRVQPLPAIAEAARIVLDEQNWQPYDRLQRTEPNHPLLLWAFSRLEGDAILKASPAWLLGWMRDPALALRWAGRVETPLQLVLVPLGAP